MFKEGQKVKCKETGLLGEITAKEWENGWRYEIITVIGTYFYRSEHEIITQN